MLVSRWGHDVSIAHDGPSALEIARQFQPHVVLLDIGLPSMNGWQVGAALLELPATRTAFLLAISGFGTRDDVAHSLEAGLHGHLVKPVDPAEMEGLLCHLHLLFCSAETPLPSRPNGPTSMLAADHRILTPPRSTDARSWPMLSPAHRAVRST